MTRALRTFQVFAKPVGAACNLGCAYCYYLAKQSLYPGRGTWRMPDDVLECYIAGHIAASPEETVAFSWHGGEPTLLGLEYFKKIVALQRKHGPRNRRIANGLQTNGTLLDEAWCRFLAEEDFAVGISIDGPAELHDRFRIDRQGRSTHARVMEGYQALRAHGIPTEILCVVHSENAPHPLAVYEFFRAIGARYLTFLPLVEPPQNAPGAPSSACAVSERTVLGKAWGEFLCTVFDAWKRRDIGRIDVQLFEEITRPAFGREPSLCVLRPTCGDVPVVEHSGDVYPCDHFVTPETRQGNILETPLAELIESPGQRAFGRAKQDTLPRYCRNCDVLERCNGGCPKNRLIHTPDGEPGLNVLCEGDRRFFRHVRPFVDQIAALISPPEKQPSGQGGTTPPGRNAPCPCGSGRKFKHCCLHNETF